MNVHLDTVFNTILHNSHYTIPFILASASLYPAAVHLQMEGIKQDIQDVTSYYLVKTHIPDKNLLGTADEKIKYIKSFIHPRHSYSYSQTTQYHLTPNIRAEARSTSADNATTFATNVDRPTILLSNSNE